MDMTLSIASLSTTTSPTRDQAGGPGGRHTSIIVNGIGGLDSGPVIKGPDYESAIRGTPKHRTSCFARLQEMSHSLIFQFNSMLETRNADPTNPHLNFFQKTQLFPCSSDCEMATTNFEIRVPQHACTMRMS